MTAVFLCHPGKELDQFYCPDGGKPEYRVCIPEKVVDLHDDFTGVSVQVVHRFLPVIQKEHPGSQITGTLLIVITVH